MSSRAFGGLAVIVMVIAAIVGVALGAVTAPERTESGGDPVTSAPTASTVAPTPSPTPMQTQVSAVSVELAGPDTAAANNRFELTGVVRGGDGGESLHVQRRLDEGDWRDFPEDSPLTSEADADGSFSIGIETARVGLNGFRIGTPGPDGQLVFSNEVSVRVG